MGRSCQPLRDTTRAIRDTARAPDLKSRYKFKLNGENYVQYEWGSVEQSSSKCRCLYVTKRSILLPSNLLQQSSMAETRYIIISSHPAKSQSRYIISTIN